MSRSNSQPESAGIYPQQRFNEIVLAQESLEKEVAPLIQRAQAVVVSNPAEHAAAIGYVRDVKGAMTKVTEVLGPICEATDKAHRQAVALRDRFMLPLKSAEKMLKDKAKDYMEAEEKARKTEQDRLNAIEVERCRKEREKQEAAARILREKEAAAQREADEARRKAEQERNAAKRLELQKQAEAHQKEATAAAAKAEAREEKAAAVIENVIHVESKIETKGAGLSKTWIGEVVNPPALIAAAVPGSVAATFLMANEKAITKFAIATKGAVAVPGIKWSEVSSLSVRK
jgi:hypothetical protein